MSYPYKVYPRDEQLRALKKIYKKKTVAVFGDMGTGKTKIGADFVANMIWHGKISRAIVIAPLPALPVWEEHFENNCDFVNFSYFLKDVDPDLSAHVLLINYDFFAPRSKKRVLTRGKNKGSKKRYLDHTIEHAIRDWAPEVIIIDEGHRIKKASSRRAKALHRLASVAEYRLDLTGTPTGNKKIIDLWSQFEFLIPGYLGEFEDYKRFYGKWGGFNGYKLIGYRNLPHLADLMRPYTVRIKKNIGIEKQFIPYPVVMPREAKDLYDKMEEDFIIEVNQTIITAPMALSKAMKLFQLSGGFVRTKKGGPDLPIHRAKLDALKEIAEEIQENGTTRLVVFARFLWEMAEIKKVLETMGWWVHRVNGMVPKDALKRFNEEGGVMLCQIQSGSIANNFQAANYMIFYSTNYSLIDFQQAVDRIHRLGQTKTCFYYLLSCRGTMDARIYRTLQENKEVADEILNIVEEVKNDRDRRS